MQKLNFNSIRNIYYKEKKNLKMTDFFNETNSIISENENTDLKKSIISDKIYFYQRSPKHQNFKVLKKIIYYKNFFLYFLHIKKMLKDSICYKDILFLEVYLTKSGKIRARKTTNLTLFQQLKLTKLIKRARASNLIPLNFLIS